MVDPKSRSEKARASAKDPSRIAESPASLAARQRAERVGAVIGASYSTLEGQPVLWAFDLNCGEHHLILAGGEATTKRVALRVHAEHSFSGMLYGKALVGYSLDGLEPHSVTQIEGVPASAGFYCDSFYIAKRDIPGLMAEDVLAVALHSSEVGLTADDAEAALAARTPEGISSPDPRAADPAYRARVRLVRSLRRYRRLTELAAPDVFLDKEARIATSNFERAVGGDLGPLPDDVRPVAEALGFTGRSD